MLRAPDHAQGFFPVNPLIFRSGIMNTHGQMVHVLHSAGTNGMVVTAINSGCGKNDRVEAGSAVAIHGKSRNIWRKSTL
jgi:hypothetical protein